jgi:hypothetical protein
VSTVPIACPSCGAWVRVAAQPSFVSLPDNGQFAVVLDQQTVAHFCKTPTNQGEPS